MYDVIVVGGGHAGIEASLAASRMQMKTLLITSDFKNAGSLPPTTITSYIFYTSFIYSIIIAALIHFDNCYSAKTMLPESYQNSFSCHNLMID